MVVKARIGRAFSPQRADSTRGQVDALYSCVQRFPLETSKSGATTTESAATEHLAFIWYNALRERKAAPTGAEAPNIYQRKVESLATTESDVGIFA
jgi:hypothetical protein